MKIAAPTTMKFKKLKRILDLPEYAVVGILENLWLFTISNASQGDVGRFTNEEIAIGIDWDQDPNLLIEALLTTGWLDRSNQYRLVVHDWADHCPNFVRAKHKKLHLPFASGQPIESPHPVEVQNEPLWDPIELQSPRVAPREGSQDASPDASEEDSGVASAEASSDCSEVASSVRTPSQAKPSQVNTPLPPKGGPRTPSHDLPTTNRPREQHDPPLPFAELLTAWTQARLPGSDALCGIRESPQRCGWWQLRLRDPWWSQHWREALRRLTRSRKARGENPSFPRGIRLDDFLKHENYVARILEGEFDDSPSTATAHSHGTRGAIYDEVPR